MEVGVPRNQSACAISCQNSTTNLTNIPKIVIQDPNDQTSDNLPTISHMLSADNQTDNTDTRTISRTYNYNYNYSYNYSYNYIGRDIQSQITVTKQAEFTVNYG